MAEAPSRKLAVLLHADVVGSTMLVHKDESIAHERFQTAFALLSKAIEDYGGIAHEIRGDALVAEFPRASDAVCAALAFQAGNTSHNLGLDDDIRPEVRIGISLGEVVVADGTITGAGVVLAQRLEQLADSNGVVVQATVSETVPTRLPFVFESLGERMLKGFNTPIRAFAVTVRNGLELPAPEAKRSAASNEKPAKGSSDKPFIAVLPFSNTSPDPEHAFFADGITEDIITELSRFQNFRVLARASAFSVRQQSISVAECSSELGVNYILEGSVRRSGNRVRITTELIDARTGLQIWTERYDRDLLDVFELQDEIARTIVAVVPKQLERDVLTRVNRQVPADLSAYDCLLRAKLHHHKYTPEDNEQAVQLLQQAIELDPCYAAAHGWLGCVLGQAIALGQGNPAELLERDLNAVRTGLSLDENDIECHRILCEYYMVTGQWDDAQRHHDKAYSLNPNDARIVAQRGELLIKLGHPEEAIAALETAMALDPFEADSRAHLLGRALLAARRYDEAADAFKRFPTLRYDHHADLAACFALLGNSDEATRHRDRVLELQPDFSVSGYMKQRTYKNAVDSEHHRTGLVQAGLPD